METACKGTTGRYYLCLFSAILRISQVLVNLSDSSGVKPHSCSSDQARSGPMAFANSSATFSALIGEGPSLKFPFGDVRGWLCALVLHKMEEKLPFLHGPWDPTYTNTQEHRNVGSDCP